MLFMKDRNRREKIIKTLLLVPTIGIGLLVIVIAASLYLRSEQILSLYPLTDLLFSSNWRPLAGEFGFLPFIMGTIWVTCLSMFISIPISLLTAIYLSEYAHPRIRKSIQPFVDLLAGIPSVVFGLFAVLLIVPLIRDYLGPFFGTATSGFSILAGGLILSIMIFPILISISFEVLQMVPTETREAALALGATRWEAVKHVVLRMAYPGLIAAIVLGFSRAFGETMAVLMVVGNVPIIPQSLFDPGYPIPALIANNYGEMMSIPVYDSALMFAALLLLFVVVFFVVISKIMLLRFRRSQT